MAQAPASTNTGLVLVIKVQKLELDSEVTSLEARVQLQDQVITMPLNMMSAPALAKVAGSALTALVNFKTVAALSKRIVTRDQEHISLVQVSVAQTIQWAQNSATKKIIGSLPQTSISQTFLQSKEIQKLIALGPDSAQHLAIQKEFQVQEPTTKVIEI